MSATKAVLVLLGVCAPVTVGLVVLIRRAMPKQRDREEWGS